MADEQTPVAYRYWQHSGETGYWVLATKEAGEHAISTGATHLEPLYASPQPALAVKGLEEVRSEIGTARGYTGDPDCHEHLDLALRALDAAHVASPPPSGEVEAAISKALAWEPSEDGPSYAEIRKEIETLCCRGYCNGVELVSRNTVLAIVDDAALSSAPATAEGWRTMDSAPLHVDVLVGAFTGNDWVSSVYKLRDEYWSEDWDNEPSHWRPLPAAPTATGGR